MRNHDGRLLVKNGAVDLHTQWDIILAYLVYALVRGAITGTYFYPFLDAGALGLGQVLINSAVLSVAFLAAGAAVVATGRRRSQG